MIGREREIERAIQILCRRTKNNPVLLGEAGVGKTAIVEGFAQRVVDGNVPELLTDKRIVVLDLAMMVAGTKYRGQFEERIKAVMNEVRRAKNTSCSSTSCTRWWVPAGPKGPSTPPTCSSRRWLAAKFSASARPRWTNTASTSRKTARWPAAFQEIIVDPPTNEGVETVEILKGLRDRYEEHHRVQITDDAIDAGGRIV